MTTLMKLFDWSDGGGDGGDQDDQDARYVSWEEGVELSVGFSASFLIKEVVIVPAFLGSFGWQEQRIDRQVQKPRSNNSYNVNHSYCATQKLL